VRPRNLLALILLGPLWGASFSFIRVAVPALGRFPLMELRVDLVALAPAPFHAAHGRVSEVRVRWKRFLVLGTLHAAVPSSLIAFGELLGRAQRYPAMKKATYAGLGRNSCI